MAEQTRRHRQPWDAYRRIAVWLGLMMPVAVLVDRLVAGAWIFTASRRRALPTRPLRSSSIRRWSRVRSAAPGSSRCAPATPNATCRPILAALPDGLEQVADRAIDSGTFHMFDDRDGRRYAASAQRVLRPDGRCLLRCAPPDPSRHWRPAGVAAAEAVASFGEGWQLGGVTESVFETTSPFGAIPANLITLERV